MDSLKLYFTYISISIRSQLEYKTSFILMSIGNFAITFIEFLGVYALFEKFGQLKGWSLYEIAIFYGLINCSFAISESFARGFDIFPNKVQHGEFDRILLRPRSLTLQILGIDFQIMRVGRLLQGLFVLIWGLTHVNIHITIYAVMLTIMALLGGISLFTGLFVLQATLSFWSIQSLEVMNSFTYGGVQMAQYPINIYKKWFQKIFIYVIPVASVNYFPVVTILGKNSEMMIQPVIGYLAPIMGFLFLAISLLIFKVGVRSYQSTGS